MDATWRDVKEVIQELLEVNQFIPPHDQGWSARFQRIDIDDSWIDRKITEFGFIAQEPSRSWIHVNIPLTRPYTGLMGNLNIQIDSGTEDERTMIRQRQRRWTESGGKPLQDLLLFARLSLIRQGKASPKLHNHRPQPVGLPRRPLMFQGRLRR